MSLSKQGRFRRLYSDNYAVSHQLVSIASISIFMCVVLVAVINSVPISPDTVALSDITDKKSMALQISTILTDSPGVASDGSPCWEEDVFDAFIPESVGFKTNPKQSQSSQIRLLSLKKIIKLEVFAGNNYDILKTHIFDLPSYIDFNININFLAEDISGDISIGQSLASTNLLVTRSVNVLVYDPDSDPPAYEYAILQVKIA